MLILGIESSCDDTSVALVSCSKDGHFMQSEKTASQIEIHKKYGGVVPEIAGRMHAEKIVPLIEEVLNQKNNLTMEQWNNGTIRPDAIAVTTGPGLITGLIVGAEAAKTLSYVWDVPLISVNHIEGHIHSVEILNSKPETLNKSKIINLKSKIIEFPALCLVVSGGHTELILMRSHTDYQILGATKDDAAGECFDKVAKLLGLPYPGGPEISKLAEAGKTNAIDFPRPMIREDNFDFSFSGLKTSALYWLRDNDLTLNSRLLSLRKNIQSPITLADFCASFEQAIVDVLVGKTLKAAEKYRPKTIILAGGVSANKKLRLTLEAEVKNRFPNSKFRTPNFAYCMDNAAMIAVAGYYRAIKKDFTDWKKIEPNPNWKVGD